MAIEAVSPLSEIDEDSFKEEDSEYNFRELYDMLLSSPDNDIIFTVVADDVDALKSGLIKRKSQDNLKMKDSGIKPDDKVLSFVVYAAAEEGQMEVRVRLRPRKGVKIMAVAVPGDL
jgi:hypothetical protein